MRPASEIHSALDLLEHDLSMGVANDMAKNNMTIARDVLRWVTGGHWTELSDGQHPWLAAFLMDDPPQIGGGKPEDN